MHTLLLGDCLQILKRIDSGSIDLVFADPPYFLSGGGGTCQGGKWACVDKGEWDKSQGLEKDHAFNLSWLRECKRVLKQDGTIWVSGTYHNINDICWFKPDASPNLSGRYFTASHETLIWAARDKSTRHTYNYDTMKAENAGQQVRSMWPLGTTPPNEKTHGRHPTQKPLALLRRIIRASSRPGDIVLDPFCGSGTTGVAALELGRRFIGIDLSADFLQLAEKRMSRLRVV